MGSQHGRQRHWLPPCGALTASSCPVLLFSTRCMQLQRASAYEPDAQLCALHCA